MLDTTVLDNRIAALIAADTTTLDQATNANYVCLVISPFVPGPNLDFTTLTEASFPGYAAIPAALGAQTAYTDTSTGLRVVEILPPVGGWTYASTGTPSPAQTVYGFVLVNHTKTVTYGGQLFPTPIVINGTGQGINLGTVAFNFTPNACV